jgi:hypothetical protein
MVLRIVGTAAVQLPTGVDAGRPGLWVMWITGDTFDVAGGGS